jgi:NAD(P)-dependent dehydrogenase (short-subunit alcohol dehydrogenase family)
MPYRFDGKVCLITGAASGIGRAAAIKLSSLGARLSLCDVNGGGLQETNRICGGTNLIEEVDVASSEACSKFVDATVNALGDLHHVFNCAGVNPTAYALTDTTDEYFNKLVDTNLKGTYSITRAAIPHLKAGSSIVNVSSIMGVSVAPNYAIYCATKWSIVGFTKAMALELGSKQIRVNAVAPGKSSWRSSVIVSNTDGFNIRTQDTSTLRPTLGLSLGLKLLESRSRRSPWVEWEHQRR